MTNERKLAISKYPFQLIAQWNIYEKAEESLEVLRGFYFVSNSIH